jgi:hypothetical protein
MRATVQGGAKGGANTKIKSIALRKQQVGNHLAESEGFEPSMGDKTHTPLAGERLQPLGQLSK